MEADETKDSTSSNVQLSCERNEPVRSRWNPKPEQILILETIFNSGMVNPPKEETVRIRKTLEQFGPVGDANVFYWFQNRRSRSRRRQRQMQANLIAASSGGGEQSVMSSSGTTAPQFGPSTISLPMSAAPSNYLVLGSSSSSSSSSSFSGGGVMRNVNDDCGLFPFSGQMGLPEINEQNSCVTSIMCAPTDNANLHYQTGFITVFINGVATEVPKGPLNMKAMFGQEDLILYHSSGVPLPVNEYGFLLHTLHHGESYFLNSAKNLR